MPVSYEAADKMVRAAHDRAAALGIVVSCVVVDEGGATIASGRMDEASVVSLAAAEAKAGTSALGRRDSAGYVALRSRPESIAFLERIMGRPISPGLGGVVIRIGGKFVGAVGVSGGTGQEDHECAEAAVASLSSVQ